MNSTAITIFSSALESAQPLACRLFNTALVQGKVANAYLLVGRGADDKLEIAKQVAARLNCEQVSANGGGSCISSGAAKLCLNCKWIAEGQHPKAWLILSGEGKSQKIPVEKVRNLADDLSMTSGYARVVVVPESDEATFHRPAANALLKSIEEPPPNCLFFFFADSTDDVLATIVSRCQVVPVAKGMELGYWKNEKLDEQVIRMFESARANFITASRRSINAPNAVPYVRSVSDSLELSRSLQDLCKQCEEHLDEYDAADQVLDLFVSCELEVVRQGADDSPATAAYASKLCDLAEKTKRQIRNYVKQANAIESFCIALNELRQVHSGEISCAKR